MRCIPLCLVQLLAAIVLLEYSVGGVYGDLNPPPSMFWTFNCDMRAGGLYNILAGHTQ